MALVSVEAAVARDCEAASAERMTAFTTWTLRGSLAASHAGFATVRSVPGGPLFMKIVSEVLASDRSKTSRADETPER
jgi:hypothetical protein